MADPLNRPPFFGRIGYFFSKFKVRAIGKRVLESARGPSLITGIELGI